MTELTRKKVLFTSHVANFQKFNRPFMRMLRDKGYEVHYASMGEEEIHDSDKTFVVPFSRSPISPRNLVAYLRLKKIIDTEEYSIIHTHTPMGSLVTRLAAKAARRKGTRLIYTAHGFHFFKGAPLLNWITYYPIERYMARHTDTLITINEEDYDRAKKSFKSNVLYVPGVGVDPSLFSTKIINTKKSKIRKSLGLKNSDYVMIYVAELSIRKNQIWLIDTLAKYMIDNPEIHLLLPGKDSLGGKLHKLIDKLGLQNRVHLLGYRQDIPQLMKISDIALSSSKQEGLPVNVIEAIYTGLPVVATDCRGNRDVIEGSSLGRIVAQNDRAAFIEAIVQMRLKEPVIGKSLETYSQLEVKEKMDKIYDAQ